MPSSISDRVAATGFTVEAARELDVLDGPVVDGVHHGHHEHPALDGEGQALVFPGQALGHLAQRLFVEQEGPDPDARHLEARR